MSFAVTAVAFMGAGAVTGAIGARNSAISQKNTLQFQAQMSEINAGLGKINAQQYEYAAADTLLSGQRQEMGVRLRGAQVSASQKVAMAANGIDIGASDTAARLLASTKFVTESDALTINASAHQQAESLRLQRQGALMGVTNEKNDAILRRASADGISPDMAFTSSLIGSAGQVASSWYGMKRSGATFFSSDSFSGGLGLKAPNGFWSTK